MFSNPEKNIEQLTLLPGMKVVDLGAGSGFYSLLAARLVGGTGRVYSVDIQKVLLAKLKNEAIKQRLLNVEIIWGDLEKNNGTRLADRIADALIVSNIFFQVKNKEVFLAEAKRILKPSGKMMLIDWSDSFGGMGPAQSDVVTSSKAKELFTKAGFKVSNEFNAGDHHYGIIFKSS